MKPQFNSFPRSGKRRFLFALSVPLITLCSSSNANELGDKIAQMFSEGSTHLALRYRMEDVQQDNLLEDATASTLRARLSLQSATVNRFTVLLEVDSIMSLGADDYDSLALDRYRGTHSIIADPVGTEINIASLTYDFSEHSKATLGRQRINHDQQRFLGSVGWRQNEQTMDALSLQQSLGDVQVDYSYIWNVNRIFAGSKDSVQASDLDSQSHALLVSKAQQWGKLSGFVYALDFDNAAAVSSISYGLTYSGNISGLTLYASYARQNEYGDNPIDYSTDYYIVEASGKIGAIKILLGQESLGSDGGRAGFSTPLATLHRYQGFTDLFLTTPTDGLDDRYISVSSAIDKLGLSASFHEFAAERGGRNYGSEWNVQLSYTLNSHFNVQAKYASYQSDKRAVDTDKLWLGLNMAF